MGGPEDGQVSVPCNPAREQARAIGKTPTAICHIFLLLRGMQKKKCQSKTKSFFAFCSVQGSTLSVRHTTTHHKVWCAKPTSHTVTPPHTTRCGVRNPLRSHTRVCPFFMVPAVRDTPGSYEFPFLRTACQHSKADCKSVTSTERDHSRVAVAKIK